jgi:hypothetical protein
MAMNVCAFCGPTRAPMRPEHVWADWISRLLRKQYSVTRYTLTIRNTEGYEFSRVAQNVDETVNYICQPCNGGWMSDIERLASPVLARLILGQPLASPLTDVDVATINAWMIKNAMVLDYGNSPRHSPFFTPRQRTLFKTALETPAHTSIWLGRFVGARPLSGRYASRYHALSGKHFGNQKSCVITFTVGQVALQLLTLRRTRRKGPLLATSCDASLPWELYLITTWPIDSGQPWPPPLHFTDETLKVLFDRWNTRSAVIDPTHR